MFESYLSGPLSEVSAALNANQPRDDAEAQQRIWVVQALAAKHIGGGTTYTIRRLPMGPGITWSPDKVGAMTYPEAQSKAWSLAITPIGAPTQKKWEDTGVVFSTTISGTPASWRLWVENVGVNKVMPKYKWSARDPNQAIQSQDYRITDRYTPPSVGSKQASLDAAAEWAKQFEIPTPEQQGANLAQAFGVYNLTLRVIENYKGRTISCGAVPSGQTTYYIDVPASVVTTVDMPVEFKRYNSLAAAKSAIDTPTPEYAHVIQQRQQTGTPAPGYDPVLSPVYTPVAKSKLPWILGGVAVVAAVGLLWWRFRK